MTEVITKMFSDMDIDELSTDELSTDEFSTDELSIDELSLELKSVKMNEEEIDFGEEEIEIFEDEAYRIAMNEIAEEHYDYSDEDSDEDSDEIFFKKSLTEIKKELDKHRKFSAVFCIGTTKKGVRCSKKRQSNKKYCKIHQPKH